MANKFDYLTGTEQGSTPATPGTGERRIYPKADGWYVLDDNGVETKLDTAAESIHPFLLMGS